MSVVRAMAVPAVGAALIAALVTALSGCADAGPGRTAAQAACSAYADTGRRQGAGTAEEHDSLVATARRQAARAAAEDRSWMQLQRDVDEFYARADAQAAAHNAGQPVDAATLDSYFAADRRVQADCAAAGNDIGPLRP